MSARHNRGVHFRWIEPGASVGAERGEVVVCIPAGDGEEELSESLRSVVAQTSDSVPILICDQRGAESPLPDVVSKLAESEERPISFTLDLDVAVCAAAPGDVVVLQAGCVVAAEWLERLRGAAYADTRVATVVPLTTDELSISAGREPPPGMSFDETANAVAACSLQIRPRLRAPAGPCTYFRRSALELVDTGPAEADFAQRCLYGGLSHVLADDVLVLSGASGTADADQEVDPPEPLARSLGAARRAVDRLSVIVDARNLTGPMNGTRVHVLELIAALARTRRVRLTAIVPPNLSDPARLELEALPDVALITAAVDATAGPTVHADVVHRPFQISTPADLAFLGQLADRLVITHQDLISYHNPSYFRSVDGWQRYRSLTRSALAIADRVVFFSAHARDDGLAEDLVEPHRAAVVHIGVDHVITRAEAEPVAPEGADGLDGTMMLCLGTDYRHKNRVFALRMLEALQSQHGWEGRLVLAGPRIQTGSSVPDEQRWLSARPQQAASVLELGEVSEAEKSWLLRRADLVVYPTVDEGFGLVPFEAADHGVPCAWASGTALSELLPDGAAAIVPWDVAASAGRALELMRDERARSENVHALRQAAASLTWESTADQLLDAYRSACNEPPSLAGARERTEGIMRLGLSEDAIRLVGPGGALPHELERPLLALATHPRLGAPLFAAIKAGYRASHRWRSNVASKLRSRTRVADR